MKYNYIILISNIIHIYSFRTNIFDNAIGKWKLLYNDNKNININNLDIDITPLDNKIDQLSVKIRRHEFKNIVTLTKMINCKVYDTSCEELQNMEDCIIIDNKNKLCSLVVLDTEKYIKSIGIFEFPLFSLKYNSALNPKYFIIWRVDRILNRLYIYFDNNTYVFEKVMCDSSSVKVENITTNTFLLTNLISFLLGKLLDKTIHLE
jgi:sporulation protein YlmC with PRC-barrel domain